MFEQIRSAVGVLEAVARGLEPWRLDGHDATGLVELAARGERICASIKALSARRVEETKVWRESGHRSAAHWIAETTGETVGAATRTLETARALDQLPETDAAFRAVSSPRSRQRRSRARLAQIRAQRPRCWRQQRRRASRGCVTRAGR